MLKMIIPLTFASVLFIGCGSSSKSKKTIDILDYFPTENTTKAYMKLSTNKEEEKTKNFYNEEVFIDKKVTSIKIDEKLDRTFTVYAESITKQEYGVESNRISMKRFISKGSTLYTVEKSTNNEPIKLNNVIVGNRSVESKRTCKLVAQLDELDTYQIPYKDDILKFECIKKESIETNIDKKWEGKLKEYKSGSVESDYDLSYFYRKKGIGLIVEIDENCYIKEGDISHINDKSKKCINKTSVHKFFL